MTATADDGLKTLLEGISQRLYDVEQSMTSGDVMGGTTNTFEEIIVDDGTSDPVVIGLVPPEDVTGASVTTGAYLENIFADVEWDEAATGADAVNFEVQLFEKNGAVRTFINAVVTAGLNYRFDTLKPLQEYSVRILPIGILGLRGQPIAYVDFTTVKDSTIPPTPLQPTVARGATTVVVKYTPLTNAQAPDVAQGHGQYEVEIDTNPAFNTGNKRSSIGNDQVISFNDIETVNVWYARVRAIDSSGNVSLWSPTSVALSAGGVVDAMIVADLSAAKITTGFLSASRIQANTLTVDKLATGTLTSQSITVAGTGQIFVGAWPTGVLLNASGLRLYQGGVEKVVLDAISGTGTFVGTINSSVINGSTIYGGGGYVGLDTSGLWLFSNDATIWSASKGIRWRPISGSGTDVGRMWASMDNTLTIQAPRNGTEIILSSSYITLQSLSTTPFVQCDGMGGFVYLGNSTWGTYVYGSAVAISGTQLYFETLWSSASADLDMRYSFTGRVYYLSSSELFKTNKARLEDEMATDVIFDFEYNAFDPFQPDTGEIDGSRTMGVMAEQVEKAMKKRNIDPHFLVTYRPGKDGAKETVGAVNYSHMVIPAIIELRKLRERVAELEQIVNNKEST